MPCSYLSSAVRLCCPVMLAEHGSILLWDAGKRERSLTSWLVHYLRTLPLASYRVYLCQFFWLTSLPDILALPLLALH